MDEVEVLRTLLREYSPSGHEAGAGRAFLQMARHLIPRHRPDFLLVGEPSGWSGVTIGYKGNLSLLLEFEGTRTHLSSPEPTTVEVALAFLDRLRAFAETHRDESGFRSLTVKVHSIE